VILPQIVLQRHICLAPITCSTYICPRFWERGCFAWIFAFSTASSRLINPPNTRGPQGLQRVMAQPYVGEIRMFAGNFAPAGWALCDGRLLPISENDTLFNLVGTTYGGDGQSTFALPDLRGRIPIHQGNGFILAETGGAEEITLTVNQIPNHNHTLMASAGTGYVASPVGALPARHRDYKAFVNAAPAAQNMHVATLPPVGGSQSHENRPPFLCVNFIISLFGIYPSPT
jgi:microcystin-dependent protein